MTLCRANRTKTTTETARWEWATQLHLLWAKPHNLNTKKCQKEEIALALIHHEFFMVLALSISSLSVWWVECVFASFFSTVCVSAAPALAWRTKPLMWHTHTNIIRRKGKKDKTHTNIISWLRYFPLVSTTFHVQNYVWSSSGSLDEKICCKHTPPYALLLCVFTVVVIVVDDFCLMCSALL